MPLSSSDKGDINLQKWEKSEFVLFSKERPKERTIPFGLLPLESSHFHAGCYGYF